MASPDWAVQACRHWKTGHCGTLNGKVRDELLNGGIFYGLIDAKVVIEQRRGRYNTVQPYYSPRY